MSAIVMASYNVFRKNDAATVSGDLNTLHKRHNVELAALQEAHNDPDSGGTAGDGVEDFTHRMAWSSYKPREARQLAIVWNPDVWRAEPFFGVRKLSDKGPVKYTPPTHVIWHGLYHRPTQTRHLVYCAHIMRGYAKEGPEAPQPQAWLDEAARSGLLRLVQLSAAHQIDQPGYTFHHLAGDLNARQNNRDRWWYPHPVLESLYERDTVPRSIDYVMHSHASADAGLRVTKRYTVGDGGGMDSDHAAQVKVMRV